jgi:hypothetical protein
VSSSLSSIEAHARTVKHHSVIAMRHHASGSECSNHKEAFNTPTEAEGYGVEQQYEETEHEEHGGELQSAKATSPSVL